MKVGSKGIQSGLAANLGKSDRLTKSDADVTSRAGASADQIKSSTNVNISSRAKDIQKAKEVAMAAPDVDMDKVAKFRSMIEKGEYKVDAQTLANKIVDDEILLASTQE